MSFYIVKYSSYFLSHKGKPPSENLSWCQHKNFKSKEVWWNHLFHGYILIGRMDVDVECWATTNFANETDYDWKKGETVTKSLSHNTRLLLRKDTQFLLKYALFVCADSLPEENSLFYGLSVSFRYLSRILLKRENVYINYWHGLICLGYMKSSSYIKTWERCIVKIDVDCDCGWDILRKMDESRKQKRFLL